MIAWDGPFRTQESVLKLTEEGSRPHGRGGPEKEASQRGDAILPCLGAPASFKRLLGGRFNEPPQGATLGTDNLLDDVTGPVAPIAGRRPGRSSRNERTEFRPLCRCIVQKAQALLS